MAGGEGGSTLAVRCDENEDMEDEVILPLLAVQYNRGEDVDMAMLTLLYTFKSTNDDMSTSSASKSTNSMGKETSAYMSNGVCGGG
jgi:hypothetical protein